MALKIAIVEDDQAISQMYRMKFEAEGFMVETAENGKFGLQLAEDIRARYDTARLNDARNEWRYNVRENAQNNLGQRY